MYISYTFTSMSLMLAWFHLNVQKFSEFISSPRKEQSWEKLRNESQNTTNSKLSNVKQFNSPP